MLLRQCKPRQRDQAKKGQPTEPRQSQNLAPLARPADPQQQHQTRQRQANQALAQNAQATRHEPGARPTHMGPLARRERPAKTQNGQADPASHQHVMVDILPPHQKCQAAAQHQRRAACQCFSGPLPGHGVQADQHQGGMQHGHQTNGPNLRAQQAHTQRLQPVQQRGLVKKRNAIQSRHHPVPADPHPATDLAIAPFIGNGHRAQAGQHQHQQQPGQAQPQRIARIRNGSGHDDKCSALPRTSCKPVALRSCANASEDKYSYSHTRASPMSSPAYTDWAG